MSKLNDKVDERNKAWAEADLIKGTHNDFYLLTSAILHALSLDADILRIEINRIKENETSVRENLEELLSRLIRLEQ